MTNNIETIVKKHIEEECKLTNRDSIIAAVSGGADSMCMLALLNDYCINSGNKLGVVHINHGFRSEAVQEAEYVRSYCESIDVPFYLREINPGECKNSEEEARIFRYRLINEVAKSNGYNKIALAHNSQDRAETMLFNLFRGTGITGLVSIRATRNEFIRPILPLSRVEIEEYLKAKGISYVTDMSNLSDVYDRNKIRHHIIPKAEEINEAAINHMYEAAEKLSKVEDFLEKEGRKRYEQYVHSIHSGKSILIEDINKEDEVIRKILIRQILCDMSPHLKDITAEHINSVDNLCLESGNRQVDLPYGICVIREYNHLVFINQVETVIRSECVDLSEIKPGDIICKKIGDAFIRIRLLKPGNDTASKVVDVPRNKYTKWFDYDKMKKRLIIRSKSEKDYIIIDEVGHKKKLNRIMIDCKIPSRIRNTIPLLAMDDEILWIVGYRDSAGYRINAETKMILEVSVVED